MNPFIYIVPIWLIGYILTGRITYRSFKNGHQRKGTWNDKQEVDTSLCVLFWSLVWFVWVPFQGIAALAIGGVKTKYDKEQELTKKNEDLQAKIDQLEKDLGIDKEDS